MCLCQKQVHSKDKISSDKNVSFQYKKYSTSCKAFLADELIYYLLIVHKFQFVLDRVSTIIFTFSERKRTCVATQLSSNAVIWPRS